MKSFFDTAHKSEIKIKINSVIKTQYSIIALKLHCVPTIPSFHWTSQSKLHPSGVKSKPGPLDSDSLRFKKIV